MKLSASWPSGCSAKVRSHPVDHAPIVSAPSVVVDIIREAIGEAVAG